MSYHCEWRCPEHRFSNEIKTIGHFGLYLCQECLGQPAELVSVPDDKTGKYYIKGERAKTDPRGESSPYYTGPKGMLQDENGNYIKYKNMTMVPVPPPENASLRVGLLRHKEYNYVESELGNWPIEPKE